MRFLLALTFMSSLTFGNFDENAPQEVDVYYTDRFAVEGARASDFSLYADSVDLHGGKTITVEFSKTYNNECIARNHSVGVHAAIEENLVFITLTDVVQKRACPQFFRPVMIKYVARLAVDRGFYKLQVGTANSLIHKDVTVR